MTRLHQLNVAHVITRAFHHLAVTPEHGLPELEAFKLVQASSQGHDIVAPLLVIHILHPRLGHVVIGDLHAAKAFRLHVPQAGLIAAAVDVVSGRGLGRVQCSSQAGGHALLPRDLSHEKHTAHEYGKARRRSGHAAVAQS